MLSKRPILIGGLGLAAGLSLLTGLEDVVSDSTTLASFIAAGAGVWWWKRQHPSSEPSTLKPVGSVERSSVEAALAALEASLADLRKELTATSLESTTVVCVTTLEAQRQALAQELNRKTLKVAIAGSPRVGKSTLINSLKPLSAALGAEQSQIGLAFTEVSLNAETPQPEIIPPSILQQDAVIYLVTEDLTDSVLADLKTLTATGQRVVLGFNKQDYYLPDDRQVVLAQIKSRLQVLSQPVAFVAIAAAPRPIKVRTHTSDKQVQERLEAQLPEITALTEMVATWQTPEAITHLVTQTVMRQTHQLRQDVQQAFNQVRHAKALPVVEQLQWTAAATAFASPVPSLDLLAAVAISGQLVMDLGQIYQQPLSLDQAKTIAAELAAVVVKLGLVEVSTQLLTTTLKSHAATYVVGGSVQAFSAAYLTRLSGESLMAYFEDRALSGQAETALSVDAIGQKLQTLLPRTQRTEFLQNLVRQGMQKIKSKPLPALNPAVTSAVESLQDPKEAIKAEAEVVN
ncbi:MAG: DUF697 domain-containing protein [Cyanobacteria bacterium P01_F01_bin.86]